MEYFSLWESGHSKGERRNFSAVLENNCVQPRAGRYAGVEEDPEMSKTELSGGKGTGMLSPTPEQDVCLLHEDDSDQSAHPYPSPMIDGGKDDLEDLAALSRQVWFDTEELEAFECDNLFTSATTAQHLRATFRSDVQVEPPEEVSVSSEYHSTSVGTQKSKESPP